MNESITNLEKHRTGELHLSRRRRNSPLQKWHCFRGSRGHEPEHWIQTRQHSFFNQVILACKNGKIIYIRQLQFNRHMTCLKKVRAENLLPSGFFLINKTLILRLPEQVSGDENSGAFIGRIHAWRYSHQLPAFVDFFFNFSCDAAVVVFDISEVDTNQTEEIFQLGFFHTTILIAGNQA